jgi:hypothetical protein
MKPPQKLRRILRVKVARENVQGQELLKIFGYIFPRKEETSNCKFTSFFRQITLLNEKDKAILETVNQLLLSGRSQSATSRKRMDWSSNCQTTLMKGSQSTSH